MSRGRIRIAVAGAAAVSLVAAAGAAGAVSPTAEVNLSTNGQPDAQQVIVQTTVTNGQGSLWLGYSHTEAPCPRTAAEWKAAVGDAGLWATGGPALPATPVEQASTLWGSGTQAVLTPVARTAANAGVWTACGYLTANGVSGSASAFSGTTFRITEDTANRAITIQRRVFAARPGEFVLISRGPRVRVVKARWTGWGQPVATARAVIVVKVGKRNRAIPVVLRASQPGTCNGRTAYTRIRYILLKPQKHVKRSRIVNTYKPGACTFP